MQVNGDNCPIENATVAQDTANWAGLHALDIEGSNNRIDVHCRDSRA